MIAENLTSSAAKTAIVFDLDGTLIDTGEDIAFSVNAMRAVTGLAPLSTPSVLRAVGRGAAVLLQKTLEVDTTQRERLSELLASFRAHYREHQGERSRPYPRIPETVRRLTETSDLYVLSNKPREAVLNEVRLAGLTDCFKKIWGDGSFSALKPDPKGILAAMERSGTDTARTVMVGDLFVDMETAARAGVPSLFVTWGFGTAKDLLHPPSGTVSTPTDLPAALAALPGFAHAYQTLGS